jgi:(p)ppGpp synthase/HD superfamily hydrolase
MREMKPETPRLPLTERFEAALIYAARAHADQLRKGTRIPYFAHILAVTGHRLGTRRHRG